MQLQPAKTNVIYWAEDDDDDVAMFKEVLSEIAPLVELVMFSNGRLLLDHLSKEDSVSYPGLIILDMNMPEMDGRETLTMLTKNIAYCNIPKVVLTTSNSAMDRMFCDWLNTEMLTKPFTYEALKNTLLQLLPMINNDR